MLTAVILTIICSTAEMTGVRMVDSQDQCTGTPEVLSEGQWKRLSSYYFDYKSMSLLCRELDCGDVTAVAFVPGDTPSLTQCDDKQPKCMRSRTFIPPDSFNMNINISCSHSVRLVGGAGRCSGRVEVKLHQSWTTVCEADFDWQDAQVVCRELGCGPPLTLQGALFGGEKHPFGDTVFQCEGTENRLLTCRTSTREQKSSPVKALGLTCSEPADVRLVAGGGRCAGTLEMLYSGEWTAVSADRWSMRETAVLCRQLDCGSAVAATVSISDGNESRWGFHITCVGSESAVRECTHLYSRNVTFPVGVVCSDSVKLVDGAGRCSGRVEVKLHQSWTTVCEADFDWQDAQVVCRELGCGPPLTLQGALFGGEKRPFGDTVFQCEGTENHLLTCRTSTREQKSSPVKALGLTCSEPATMRLVSRSSRCAGTLEMFQNGQWRTVGADTWSMREADMVCLQLHCGSAVAALKTKRAAETPEVGVLISCRSQCFPMRIWPIQYLAGVICSEFLVKPTILQGSERFRGRSFTITCSTQPQYPGGLFHLNLPFNISSKIQAAVNHSASFYYPAADDSHQGNYSCVYENTVIFQNVQFQDKSRVSWCAGPFIYNFSSESEPLFLTVTDFPWHPIIRMLLVPSLMLIVCSLIFLISKKCGHVFMRNTPGQTRAAAENIELVCLKPGAEEQQTVEERSGEERYTDLEEEEEDHTSN